MDIDLPVHVVEVGGGEAELELTVGLEPSHSVGALVDALVAFLGLDPAHPWYVGPFDGHEPYADEHLVCDIGLVAGRRLVIAPGLSWWPGDSPGGEERARPPENWWSGPGPMSGRA